MPGVTAEGLNPVAKAEQSDLLLSVRVQPADAGDEGQAAIRGMANAPRNFSFYEITLETPTGRAVTEAAGVIAIKLPYEFTNKKNSKVYQYHGGAARELTGLSQKPAQPYEDGKYFADPQNGCIYLYSSKFSTYAIGYDKESTGGSVSAGGSRPTRYTVTFDPNGGTAVEAQTVSRNGTVTRPEGIRREGYQFAGWYRDPGFTASYDFTKPVTGNLTLYAKWVQDSGKDDPDDGKDDPQNPPSHACPSKEFHDLDVGAWYHEDTDFVLSHQLMKGTEEAIFSPDEPLTRGMLVAILYRSEGEPQAGKAHTFADVEPGAYYEKAVSWAQEQGVVKGVSETEFAPNDPITREQIAAILYRYAQYKGRDLSAGENTNILSYSDFDHISEYAIPALQWAAGMGVICGKTEATLNPQDSATRAEIAALLHRFLEQK